MKRYILRHLTFVLFAIASVFTGKSQDVCFLEEAGYEDTRATEKLSNYPKLSDEFKKELGIPVGAGRPCVIDFSASWCMPCMQFAPTFNQYASLYRGKIDMVSCNVDYHRGITANYGVKAIPNILLFDVDGTPVKRFTGIPSTDEFAQELEKLLVMGIETVSADQESEWYTLDGLKVKQPSAGLYIRVKGKETDVVYVRD